MSSSLSFSSSDLSKQSKKRKNNNEAIWGNDSITRTNIVVKHLPKEVDEKMVRELVEFGAGTAPLEVKHWQSRGTAFVRFEDNNAAARAFKEINRLNLLGKTIIVEWAKDEYQKNREKAKEEEEFERKTLGGAIEPPDPIAPSLGITYGPPPHLEYNYPPPNEHILDNIYNAIASVPQLYIQVLHLMNKMNLPPPFGSALPCPPSLKKRKKKQEETISESESEVESEEEEEEKQAPERKPTTISHQTVFPQQKVIPVKPIQIQLPQTTSSTTPQISEIPFQPKIEQVGPPKLERRVLSIEEIHKNRWTIPEIMEKLPNLFKKGAYDPGIPSSKLFLKNLPKKITIPELELIFSRYFDDDETMQRDLKIQLMTGRMAGQAFVTFPTIDQSQQALAELNGYLVEPNKPMIVQFGKSSEKKS